MRPILSVIVPVYNSSKTLARCIKSLQLQTMKSLEIILVDDGSTDSSGEMCDQFASNDEKICVIHQENSGALLARMTGCRVAKADYISFVDSDDWVEDVMFKTLYSEMNNADMVASGIYRDAFDGSVMERIQNRLKEGYYDLTDVNSLKGFFFSDKYVSGKDPSAILIGLWGKIFRRETIFKFINILNVRIREGEDWLFNALYILHCKGIRIVEKCYYHYSDTINSITHTSNFNFVSEQNVIYNIVKQELLGHPAEKMLIKQIQKRFMHNLITATGKKMDFDDEVVLPKWSFPSDELLINNRVVLFGAGQIGQSYLKDWKKKKINVVCWVDNVPGKIKVFEMIPKRPEIIKRLKFDYVVCGVKGELAYESIRTQLLDYGIDEQKILWEKPVDIWMEYFCNE